MLVAWLDDKMADRMVELSVYLLAGCWGWLRVGQLVELLGKKWADRLAILMAENSVGKMGDLMVGSSAVSKVEWKVVKKGNSTADLTAALSVTAMVA